MAVALVVAARKDASGVHELDIVSVPVPAPEADSEDVVVAVRFGALNRRDHWIRREMYPALQFPWILGADCCGIVTAVGNPAKNGHWVGRRVVLNASIGKRPRSRLPAVPTIPLSSTVMLQVGALGWSRPRGSACTGPSRSQVRCSPS